MNLEVKIAIASGKGGTGKTTVAANLAWTIADLGCKVQYIDCDVEEPNGHLFLKPTFASSESVGILVPVVDEALCNSCRRCAEVCEFHAIAVLKKAVVFPELCHGCGGCAIACPTGAIREISRPIGTLETGSANNIAFVHGRLNVGEPMAPPLINAVKRKSLSQTIVLFDAPPGTSCPVVATIRDTNFVLLVTEPTPFGLNDLALAVQMIRALDLPHAVVINRSDIGDARVRDYCNAEAIPILAELPDDRRLAETYSRGELAAPSLKEWKTRFQELWRSLNTIVSAKQNKASATHQ